jgi:hypothetical protein
LFISQGTWRLTIVIPSLGIAIKLPQPRIGTLWRHYKEIRTISELLGMLRSEIRYYDHPAQAPMCLLGGWLMNLRESWFTLRHGRDGVTVPTYASLFGLINLMPAGKPCWALSPKRTNRTCSWIYTSGVEPQTSYATPKAICAW